LFKGASEFLTMSAIVNGDIPRPSQYRRDVPPALEAIMMKALARDPRDRFATAGEMAIALDQVAIEVGVGASTTALANYMRLQFGEVKEPWLLGDDFESETTDVDFDGGASGLAPPPPESVKNNAIPRRIQVTRSSPISQVRNIITPSKPAEIDKSYSVQTDVDPPAFEPRRASTDSDLVPPLPAPPKRGSDELIDASRDAIARELPIEPPMLHRDEPRAKGKGLWVGLGALVVVVAVAGAIVLWPSAQLPSNIAAEQPAPVVKPPSAEPPPEAQPEPKESALSATMSDYHADAGVPEDVPEDAIDKKPALAAKSPPLKRESKPPPTTVETKRTVAPVKRSRPTPKKSAAKPKWNPDQLFLGD
jgi:serine/threonine-protein kinase